ncbi:MAG: hypothetical protein LAT63_00835 [Marinobacter sp.]|nr:hypothetical protein [Marinobacter sp.]
MRRLLLRWVPMVLVFLLPALYLLYAPLPSAPHPEAHRYQIQQAELIRDVQWVLPPELGAGAGIVLALHPSQSDGDRLRAIIGPSLESWAAEQNLIVVYPDGFEGHFNDCRKAASYSARTRNVDDVAFLRQVVEQLVQDYPVDRSRVYGVGFSNGGHMAMRLAWEAPGLLRGLTAISALVPTAENLDCELTGSLPAGIALIAGTRDPISPYRGGRVTLFGFGNRGNVLSAYASGEWFAGALGIEAAPQPASLPGVPVMQTDWSGDQGCVRLLSIEGGGHTIPQAHYRYPRLFGATLASDAVLQAAWHAMQC